MDNKKLLTICNYITDDNFSQFLKNKTGYGYIVGDIVQGLSKYFQSSVYTYSGNYKAFKYGNVSVLGNGVINALKYARPRDYIDASNYLIKNFKHKKEALRVAYSFLSRGYLFHELNCHDLVHVHGCTPNLMPYIEFSLNLGKRTLVTLHGLNSFSNETKATPLIRNSERYLLKLLCKSNDLHLSVLTPAARTIICDYIGISVYDKISVVPNFVNSSFSELNIYKKRTVPKLVLYVGNLSIQKNQKALLHVIQRNTERFTGSVKFLFVGEVCDDFSAEIDFFKNKTDLVEFIGHIERAELVEYYEKSSLIVLLSKVEGFGMSIVEGFCGGSPCLINGKMEIGSLLDEKEFIFRVNDISHSAEVEKKLDTALSLKINSNDIRDYAQTFSNKTVIKKYLSLLKQ